MRGPASGGSTGLHSAASRRQEPEEAAGGDAAGETPKSEPIGQGRAHAQQDRQAHASGGEGTPGRHRRTASVTERAQGATSRQQQQRGKGKSHFESRS